MQPTLYAVAGAPASGKTTFVAQALSSGLLPAHAFIHDCDATMVGMEDYRRDVLAFGPVKAFAKWELPARELAECELLGAIETRQDIVYDRSCALPGTLEFFRNLVEHKNYRLVMHVIHVDPSEAVRRAKARELTSGRHIPESVVLERAKSLRSLWKDYLSIPGMEAVLYSPQFEVVARYKNDVLSIQQDQIYREFLGSEST